MKKSNGRRYLDQREVTAYAKRAALLKEREKRQARLRRKLLDQMQEGYLCPRGGPYLVILSSQERKKISWKESFEVLAKKLLGKRWHKAIDEVEDNAPVTQVPMLLSQVNPDYRVEPRE